MGGSHAQASRPKTQDGSPGEQHGGRHEDQSIGDGVRRQVMDTEPSLEGDLLVSGAGDVDAEAGLDVDPEDAGSACTVTVLPVWALPMWIGWVATEMSPLADTRRSTTMGSLTTTGFR
jgi:hypothetical protein